MTWFWARKLSSTVQALQDVLLRMQRRDLAEILGPVSEEQVADAMDSVKILGGLNWVAICPNCVTEYTVYQYNSLLFTK